MARSPATPRCAAARRRWPRRCGSPATSSALTPCARFMQPGRLPRSCARVPPSAEMIVLGCARTGRAAGDAARFGQPQGRRTCSRACRCGAWSLAARSGPASLAGRRRLRRLTWVAGRREVRVRGGSASRHVRGGSLRARRRPRPAGRGRPDQDRIRAGHVRAGAGASRSSGEPAGIARAARGRLCSRPRATRSCSFLAPAGGAACPACRSALPA